LLHITKVLIKTPEPEELICSNSESLNKENVELKSDQDLKEAFDDVY